MNTSILEDFGLSNSEIKIYLALLEIGASTSGPIINKTALHSSVVHRSIKILLNKGLVTFVKIGKDKKYQSTDPKNLLNYIDTKRKKLFEILPELELKQKLSGEKNETEMYLGKKAIFSLLLNLIKDGKSKEEYFSFSLIEAHGDKDIIRFYKNYNLRRREIKLNVKVLVNKNVKTIFEKNYSKELLKKANIRYSNFHFPQGIIIFRNNVVFLNWEESPFAVRIQNNLMASQFRTFFIESYNKEKNGY